jgi:cysteinyl-tRNA synthetase
MFPHHENELAQSESYTGQPFARYWMHNGLMQSSGAPGKVGGQHDRHGDVAVDQASQEANKLAGSKGAASVKELFAAHSPEGVRFFLLRTHYRSPIEFSDALIAEAEENLEKFYRLFEAYQRITGEDFYAIRAATSREKSAVFKGEPADFSAELAHYRQRFLDAMDDDFNTGGAVGVLFEMLRSINGFIAKHKLDAGAKADDQQKAALRGAMTLLKELSQLLGVFRKPVAKASSGGDDAFAGSLMQLIIELRADARKSKNFAVADKIRDGLAALKVTIEDRPDGTTWRRE